MKLVNSWLAVRLCQLLVTVMQLPMSMRHPVHRMQVLLQLQLQLLPVWMQALVHQKPIRFVMKGAIRALFLYYFIRKNVSYKL